MMIKKILLILFLTFSLLVINGCEKDFNNLIEPQTDNIQVSSVAPLDKVVFNSTDSSITFSISFSSVSGLSSVLMNIFSPSNEKINDKPIGLFDSGNIGSNGDTTAGDLTYSNKYLFSSSFENGAYNVEYIVELNKGTSKNIASQHFVYDNGQNNIAPVISDVFVDPDTLIATGTVTILTSIKVSDQNGLSDIDKVYFIVVKPDGSTNNTQIEMFDDGNVTADGDKTAGDGTYSRLIQINQNNIKGTYILNFTARDKAGALSNTISHNLLVK